MEAEITMVKFKRLMAGLAALLLQGALLSEQLAAAENTTTVAEGVYLFEPGDGYTSMFVVTSDGVVAIEPVISAML